DETYGPGPVRDRTAGSGDRATDLSGLRERTEYADDCLRAEPRGRALPRARDPARAPPPWVGRLVGPRHPAEREVRGRLGLEQAAVHQGPRYGAPPGTSPAPRTR